jgi:hypothetical protein
MPIGLHRHSTSSPTCDECDLGSALFGFSTALAAFACDLFGAEVKCVTPPWFELLILFSTGKRVVRTIRVGYAMHLR